MRLPRAGDGARKSGRPQSHCAMNLSIRRSSGATGDARNAGRAWASRSGLLLGLHAGSARGLGEASPLPGYSPDTLESAGKALGALNMAALERALNLDDTEESLKSAANLLPRTEPAARMALETAVLDLRGRQRHASAPTLLGAVPMAERRLAWLAGAPDEGALAAIRRAERAGYDHFKIKLGGAGNFRAEIEGVRELRRALGAGPSLRLDANRAWSDSETVAAGNLLAALDIEFVEEPSSRLTHSLGASIPVALDESLQGVDPEDLEALARRLGAHFVVLKPMVLGGLSHCLALARHAAALDLGVVVSHSFDGPVGLIAAAALALALPTRVAQGLAPHAGLAAWRQIPLPITSAALRAWNTPGLGFASELFD
jgi:o-succinylbenzoate synthase